MARLFKEVDVIVAPSMRGNRLAALPPACL
jgi:hypothetical protein